MDKKKLKILMLEDNPDDVGLIERILRKDKMEFITHRVETRDTFNEAIHSFQPDIVLSDHGLPQFNSIDALKICSKLSSTTPFILVTGTVTDDFAVTCLKQGADDYILKSNLQRLPSAIRKAIKERRLEMLKKKAKKDLRRQNAELKKVNRELDSFVYSVSHNLRGPLASVLGLLNVVEYDSIESAKRFHSMMKSSILRLDQTLVEILDYSKNVHIPIENSVIDFNALLQTVIANHNYLLKDYPVTWHIEINDDVQFISDVSRLKVILSSVLANAIKYRKTQGDQNIKINISVSSEQAVISIVDQGVGIRKDVLPKVFNMFYRGTELSNGAGLGLYITHDILTKMMGKIEITSQENAGTHVVMTIPNNAFGGRISDFYKHLV